MNLVAVYGVALPEAPTMKASCYYLSDIFSKKDVYSGLERVVTQIAPQLYDVMLRVSEPDLSFCLTEVCGTVYSL